MNVSRVIGRLGGQSLAVYTAGGPVGEAYRRRVDAEHVPSLVVPISGETRESFTVDEVASGEQFRFVLEGPELAADEWEACLDAVRQAIRPDALLVASGSLPPGVPADFYARAVRIARNVGAECIVDCAGAALAEVLKERVLLIAPSRRELEEHSGQRLATEASRIDAASALVAGGEVQYVALTLGAEGAMLVSSAGVLRLAAPPVKAVSTVGAGDSFVAGMTLRLAQGQTIEAAFAAGVAAGCAAVLNPATELCRRADVERLEAELTQKR